MSPRLLILVVLIILSAIFSASETALMSLSKSKMEELLAKKSSSANILKKLRDHPHKFLIAILLGSNVINTGASAYAALIFTEMFGSSGLGIATGIMTFFILVFGDMVPKSFAHQHAEAVSLFFARPIYYFQILIYPIVIVLEFITKLVHRLFGNVKSYSVTEGEIMALLKIGAQEGAIEKQERELIENVLEFNDIEASDVMTPRVAIESLNCETSIQEAVDLIKTYTHSRIPVYRDDIDHVIGIITVTELLEFFDEHSPKKKLKNLDLMMPLVVPMSKKINKLFREFQRKHIHIALVIDEFGGTAGLVTLEDLLEEIVGEIEDEKDLAEKMIDVVDKKTLIVSGEAEMEDVNDFFQVKFWPEDHDSLNTMILEFSHRFPREGEIVKLPMGKVQIIEMENNVIKKAKVTKKNTRKV